MRNSRRILPRVIIVVMAAASIWYAERRGWLPDSSRQAPQSPAASRELIEPPADSTHVDSTESVGSPERPSAADHGNEDRPWLLVRNQTIRNEQGRVVFRGDIDLRPTVDRIGRGERDGHRNDGTVFQNRERRLPRRESGYYREYVHPTPDISGPGPQRLVIGAEGDVYYTPDHYQTFRKLK